jgi:N-methylhydantoinase A
MVVVPPRPGVLSTWGLLDTDIRATFVRTVGTAQRSMADGAAVVSTLDSAWAELEAQARVWLDGEQVPRDQMRFERAADLRYEHQSFELTCPLGAGPLTSERLGALVSTFHAEHRRLYTYDLPNAPIELVTLRITAIGALPRRAAAALESLSPTGGERGSSRPVYFRGRGFIDTPRYARDELTPGMTFDGPAIIEQSDSTPLVAPGFRARVDEAHNLLLERV